MFLVVLGILLIDPEILPECVFQAIVQAVAVAQRVVSKCFQRRSRSAADDALEAFLGIGQIRFRLGGGQVDFDAHGLRRTDEYGTIEEFARVRRAAPTRQQLEAYAGTYASEEADAELRAVVESGKLVLKRSPDTTIALTPLYDDTFSAGGLGTVFFRRDSAGKVVALSASQDRVWDLHFRKK